MQFILLGATDNAEGQLDASISGVALSIALGSGEGSLFPETINGSATSSGDANTLNSTAIQAAGVEVGMMIENLTDGSHAYIISVSTNAVETTDLEGGSDNTWQNADEWAIGRFVVTINSRATQYAPMDDFEEVLVKQRTGDTLTLSSRGYNGTSAQTWQAGDYVSLYVVAKHLDFIYGALAENAINVQDLYAVADTKADITYVDAALAARNWKQSVRVATTVAGTLATSFENGDTVDGVALATGDRILIKDQAAPAENGIYIVAASGAPARATDFDSTDEVTSALVAVESGTENGDSVWICTSDDPVIGTDPLVFSRFTLAEYNTLRAELLFLSGETLTDSGTANAYIVTCDDLITSLSYGQVVRVKITNENTGDSTLRFKNSLSLDETDSIRWPDGTKLLPGDLPANSIALFGFDGTNWQLLTGKNSQFRNALRSLKEDVSVYEYVLQTSDYGGSAGTPLWYQYQMETKIGSTSASDLNYAYRLTGYDNPSAASGGPAINSTQKYGVTGAFCSTSSDYNYGFFGYRSARDCPGLTDTAHHAGFLMQGSTVYASVGNGASQSYVDVTSDIPSLSAYSVFRVRFNGTDWEFYIDDMDTPVATITTNKPTIGQLAYWFFGIDSNNTDTHYALIKRKIIFEGDFSA